MTDGPVSPPLEDVRLSEKERYEVVRGLSRDLDKALASCETFAQLAVRNALHPQTARSNDPMQFFLLDDINGKKGRRHVSVSVTEMTPHHAISSIRSIKLTIGTAVRSEEDEIVVDDGDWKTQGFETAIIDEGGEDARLHPFTQVVWIKDDSTNRHTNTQLALEGVRGMIDVINRNNDQMYPVMGQDNTVGEDN